MLRRIVALVGVLALFFVLFALFTPMQVVELTREQAVELVLNDLDELTVKGALVSFLSIKESEDYAWEMELKIVTEPYSRCPKVEKRYYTFAPFGYRPELVLLDCVPRPPLIYPEEALIASGKDYCVASMDAGKGCAFWLEDFESGYARTYCPWLAEEEFHAFASNFNESVWITQWVSGDDLVFIALNEGGVLLDRSDLTGAC